MTLKRHYRKKKVLHPFSLFQVWTLLPLVFCRDAMALQMTWVCECCFLHAYIDYTVTCQWLLHIPQWACLCDNALLLGCSCWAPPLARVQASSWPPPQGWTPMGPGVSLLSCPLYKGPFTHVRSITSVRSKPQQTGGWAALMRCDRACPC